MPTSRKRGDMKCKNCNGVGIINLYEITGENVSTDCHLCDGTGQISHKVEEQSQFNDWYKESDDEDV
jgi:DnaJ-class molecular chaperone